MASANPDKARELRQILEAAGLADASALEALPAGWSCEETGLTIEENALLKARSAAEATGLPAIADDTGLFVAGLGGAPGVYTSRFAGPGCSYEDNVRKLLKVLLWERGDSRSARFRTAAACVMPSGEMLVEVGEMEGLILDEPRGGGGFGYDPVFFVPGLGCTLAECTPERKNSVCHRCRALQALVEAGKGTCL